MTKNVIKDYTTDYLVDLYQEATMRQNLAKADVAAYDKLLDTLSELILERFDNKSDL